MSWENSAACAGRTGEFVMPEGRPPAGFVANARRICAACPVLDRCKEAAVVMVKAKRVHPDDDVRWIDRYTGMFAAGMTVRERTPLLRLPDDADDFEHGRPYSYRTCVARDGKPCADCLEAHNRYRHPNGTNPGRSAGVDDFDYAGARRRRLAILRVIDSEGVA
jgi:hypothetical protein